MRVNEIFQEAPTWNDEGVLDLRLIYNEYLPFGNNGILGRRGIPVHYNAKPILLEYSACYLRDNERGRCILGDNLLSYFLHDHSEALLFKLLITGFSSGLVKW